MSEPTEANAAAEAAPADGTAEPAGGAGRRHVRVVLVDDHRMFRTGVQAEIGQTEQTGVEVVGEAADVDQAVTVITATAWSTSAASPTTSTPVCSVCPISAWTPVRNMRWSSTRTTRT